MNLLKKIVCFCFTVLFCGNIAWAQCPPGDVELTSQAEVDAFAAQYPNCTELGGDLVIDDNTIISLSALTNVTSVGGNLYIMNNSALTSLNGLNNLTVVGDSLYIDSNQALTSLSGLENLNSIGGDLWIKFNVSLMSLSGLGNLTTINGSLQVDYNHGITSLSGLENLTSIGENFEIRFNFDLTSLSGLNNLTSVGGDFWIRDSHALTSLNGLDNLNSIEGDLVIGKGSFVDYDDQNESLTSLSGLESLTSLGGSLRVINNIALTSLSGLDNLTSVEGVLINENPALTSLSGLGNLTSVVGVSVHENEVLTSLSGLDNLISVDGNLSIDENVVLTSLSGLDNLASVGGDLLIDENPVLTSLSSLDNLTLVGGDLTIRYNDALTSLVNLNNLTFLGEDLRVYRNGDLAICDVPFICSHIINGGYTYIANNATGCDSETEVNDNCYLARIYTNTFYDLNQNKVRDSNEPDYTDATYLIDGNSYATIYGNIYLGPGSYTIALDTLLNPNWQLSTDSLSYFLNLEENEIDTVNFGMYPTQQISYIQTIINPVGARCNETITLEITTKNLGTTLASGITWLAIDDVILDFTFIHPLDTIIEGLNAYGWYFNDLYPSQSIKKQVEVQIPGPPDFMPGDLLAFYAYVDFEDMNGSQSTQPFIYETVVRCSYDPNDKLVNPNREGDYVLFKEDLIYTIRFQNTGNDVAYDVVIRDTLNTNLDLSTFRVLGSSHADRLNTILNEDERILTFEFRDIFLPDSTSNFEASQGYVTYLIKTIDGLAEETSVTNSAGIYFDMNPPVITNTTQNIMVSELPAVSTETPDNSFNFNILPNPNLGVFTVQGIPKGTYQILNISGQIIRQGDMQNDLLIDISREAQGVYFISVTVDNATSVRRIVKM